MVLKWNNRQNVLTIPLDPNTNVATITTAPGFKELHAYYAHIKEDESSNEETFPTEENIR